MSDEYFYGNYPSSYIQAFGFVIISAKIHVLHCISTVFSLCVIYLMDAAKSKLHICIPIYVQQNSLIVNIH